MLPQQPYLGVIDGMGCPLAFRVTRWFEPQPMRKTLVRAPGESEQAFCDRAQELAYVWQATGLLGAHKHSMLVTIQCLYTLPRDAEWADDRWLGQQAMMQIIGDVKTTERVRLDALQALKDLSCVQ